MASGTLSVNSLTVVEDSGNLTQLTDTSLSAESHMEVLTFNDSGTDGSHGDGFVNKVTTVQDIDQVQAETVPVHDSLLAFNDLNVDTEFADGWVGKSVTDILESFQVTVEGLVTIELNQLKGRNGNAAGTDLVAFTDTLENGYTMALCSCGSNNLVMKREPTDPDFVFLAVLGKGEILNLALPAGTIFKSLKGINGFSSPFPMPFGVSSLSDTYFRMYAFRQDNFVYATSAGLESVVTLFASDETTVVDGPYTIPPYGSATLTCNANAEFVVTASKAVYCGTLGEHSTNGLFIDMRLIPPMSIQIITWNRFCRVSSQELGTTVRWYRQNGETGSFTVNAGTPVAIYTGTINEDVGATNTNAGSTTDYGSDGCIILTADKPISGWSGADSQGWESTTGWPTDQLAQVFSNPSTMDDNTDAGRSSISIGSLNEGTASVYDSTSTLIATFAITRGVSVTTPDDQLYPASGQWVPLDSGLTDFTGGYVEVNVPSVCIVNYNGSGIWTSDAGDEIILPGVTPDDIRATIVMDPDGFRRRRDVDASGVESWNIC